MAALLVAVIIRAQSDDDPAVYGESYVDLYLRENPGIPPVMPVALPEDIRFLGYDTTRLESGRAVMRSAQFAGKPYSDHPVQTVCIEWRRRASECASLVADGAAVTRELENIRVTVVFGTSSAASADVTAFWQDVPLTSDLADAAWLQ
ncbi:hypothetical protein AB0P41_05065 [Streptomyces sp. NPDC079167]|uniref:hypothetical protein n=1 Tax=Streptomyces sp. NPDC079167 TaxID=3154513 RepID=UPI0034374B3A